MISKEQGDGMTLYTYREALEEYGSRSVVLSLVSNEELFHLQRNLYSTNPYADRIAQIMKMYPQSIVTGHTAFYIHGLTDKVPARIDLATQRNSTKIRDSEIKQHFVSRKLLDIGSTIIDHDGIKVRIYCLEMMLFYLVHNDGKLPVDLFKEIIKSYRKQSGKLNYSELQRYSNVLPGGRRNLERIVMEIL